ncbi:MAG: 4-(cytidine 5'-diphospho)-2-C-methyl-D-erythritol kinase, partial [Defluviitaleaceae bacterium]|nr:4-(cytidine 5'-diphospho)-2-C-methyl-D-erythritol kinase [Defluviitaleaceae bacterium]
MSNNSVSLKANAKINISLDILGRRDNGYHDLETIMQSVSLHDEVFVKKIDKKGIKIVSDVVWLPTDSRNICHKVANIIFNMYGINSGLYIELAKNIPACAGLGGGSSNAAAVIYAIKKIFDLNMDEDKMLEIGGMVGADVPFCIKRGTYLARGIGEILEKLPP